MQERKFCNPLTGDVMAESARWMPDFSAVRAAQAFAAVETYASNVINQPWRVEFREIKVTSLLELHLFAAPNRILTFRESLIVGRELQLVEQLHLSNRRHCLPLATNPPLAVQICHLLLQVFDVLERQPQVVVLDCELLLQVQKHAVQNHGSCGQK